MQKCFKKCLQSVQQPHSISFALLFLRLVGGTAFIIHGWGKIQNPMAWMGPDAPVPGVLQFLAALSEFGGGIAWILGFLTTIFSAGIACTMAVATYMHMMVLKDPFINPKGGGSYELASIYLAIALLLIATGPGKHALDGKIFGYR